MQPCGDAFHGHENVLRTIGTIPTEEELRSQRTRKKRAQRKRQRRRQAARIKELESELAKRTSTPPSQGDGRTPPQIVADSPYPAAALAAFVAQEMEAWGFEVVALLPQRGVTPDRVVLRGTRGATCTVSVESGAAPADLG